MPQRNLILIKHGDTVLVPEVTAERWHLSDLGRQQARQLADYLRPLAPVAVVTSTEPKAAETGAILAHALHVPSEVGYQLHEHDRSNVPLIDRAAFEQRMGDVFAHPDDNIYGLESAAESRARFTTAIERVLREQPPGNVAVVAHGTVIALFVALHNHLNGFDFWKRFGTPAYVVLSVPGFEIVSVMDHLPGATTDISAPAAE
jgi:2,3-bisphosphoglycerate-dependent phosphoglycerate mutase